MTLLKIARLGHPAIRDGAKSVTDAELHAQGTQRLIDDMVDTMRDADGVGIAAPQVHVAKRIIVVEVSPDNPRYLKRDPIPLTVIVNPQILSKSAEQEEGWEGCLSVPDLRGLVPRAYSVELAGVDRYGDELHLRASGFFARVIQHEVDHLDGHIFMDRLPDLATLTHLREYQKYWVNS